MNFFKDVPENITAPRSRMAYILFRWMYIFETGKGQLFGRILSMASEFGIAYLVLDKLGVKPNLMAVILTIITIVILCWMGGYFYLKNNLDRINNQIGQMRNPQMNDIHNKIMKGKGEKF